MRRTQRIKERKCQEHAIGGVADGRSQEPLQWKSFPKTLKKVLLLLSSLCRPGASYERRAGHLTIMLDSYRNSQLPSVFRLQLSLLQSHYFTPLENVIS